MDKICELIKQANEIIINNDPIQLINNQEHTIQNLQSDNLKLSNELKIIDTKYIEQINKLSSELELKVNELKQKNEELTDFAKFSILQRVNKQLEEKNNYIKILESQLEKSKNRQPVSPKTIVGKPQVEDKPIIISEQPKAIIEVENNTIIVNEEPQLQFVEKPKKPKKSQIIHEDKPVLVEEKVVLKEESLRKVEDKPIREEEKVVQVEEKVVQIEEKVVIKEEPMQEVEDKVVNQDKPKEKQRKIKEINNDNFNPDNFIEINGYELMMYKKKYYIRDLETNQLYDIQDNKPNNIVGLYNTITGKIKLN